jgi:putative ABC transport system permease protein
MIFTSIKQQLQSLKSNRLFTALNLCGFVLGLTASMILALYVYREYNVGKCFPNHKNIYLLVNARNNRVSIDCDLAEMLKDRFPEVENATPLNGFKRKETYLRDISNNELITDIGVASVSADFFRMFSVKMLIGNPDSPFTDPNSAVISASLAQKLFGRLDVVGESFSLSGWLDSAVSAVVEDLPEDSGFSIFEVFINSENKDRRFSTHCNNNECHNPMSVYVRLGKTASPDKFTEAVNRSFPPIKGGVDSIRIVPVAETYMAADLDGKATQS